MSRSDWSAFPLGLDSGSFGSVPLSTSSLSENPSPSVSFFSGSVPFSISSLSDKPSPSVSVVVAVFPSTGTSTTSLLPSP